jgi:hypothetical protein
MNLSKLPHVSDATFCICLLIATAILVAVVVLAAQVYG